MNFEELVVKCTIWTLCFKLFSGNLITVLVCNKTSKIRLKRTDCNVSRKWRIMSICFHFSCDFHPPLIYSFVEEFELRSERFPFSLNKAVAALQNGGDFILAAVVLLPAGWTSPHWQESSVTGRGRGEKYKSKPDRFFL